MTATRCLTALTAFAFAFGICRDAHANSLSPFVYFWPGIISITVVYAFPASLLASFLERPFLTAAGIKRRPLVYSLRANFLSTIAGILLIPIGYPALYTIGPLWCIAAFGCSCAVEILYLQRFSHQSFAWGRVIGGNAISSLVLMLLPPIAILIRQNNTQLAWSLEPHQGWLVGFSFGVSVAAFLGSFVWRSAAKPEAASTGPANADASPTELEPGSLPAGAEATQTV